MMVKKLRWKFVTVTMIFMTVVFGGILIFDHYHTKYWNEQEKIALTKLIEGSDATDKIDINEFYALIADADYDEYKPLGDTISIVFGFLVLLAVSFLLSRFVTEPAEKALEREKQFISDASHELKTPLAAISINAQALKAEIGKDKHIEHILSETERMNGLIQKLLKLSYADESGRKIEKQKFSLSKACEEMVLTLESNIFERQINFDYEIADDIFYFGNEDDIKQVIAILLDNAMKHTPKSGNIFFKLQQSGKVDSSGGNSHVAKNATVITVENSGEGISEKDLPHIFERFYRIDKSRTANSHHKAYGEEIASSDSYGLGLAIAKSILDAHNATITATSEMGKGVKFEIEMNHIIL